MNQQKNIASQAPNKLGTHLDFNLINSLFHKPQDIDELLNQGQNNGNDPYYNEIADKCNIQQPL